MGRIANFAKKIFGKNNSSGGMTVLHQQLRGLFTRSIFNIPEVRTAINMVAEIVATVPIWRTRIDNETGEIAYINDNIDYILNYSPNPLQNKSQFWSMVVTKLMLHNAVAMQVVYGDDDYILGLFPLPYHQIRPLDDLSTIEFADDPEQKKYDAQDLIILTRFSQFGRGTENHATDLYEEIIQAIQKRAIENTKEGNKIVAAYTRTLANMTGRIKQGDTMRALLDEANKQVESSTGATKGFIALDGATSITALNIPEVRIEKELLAIIIRAVYNYFGISQSIIDGTAIELEWQQFILKFIKFCCDQMQRECTRKIFSMREIAHGNRIEFDYMALQISTLTAKVQLMNNGILNGYLCQDDCREYIGQPPLPNGLGKEYRGNLNSANLKIIDEYQLSKAKNQNGVVNDEK